MLLTSRPAVALSGLRRLPAGQRAREDLAENRQAIALVSAHRQQRTYRRPVEHRGITIGATLAVDRASRRAVARRGSARPGSCLRRSPRSRCRAPAAHRRDPARWRRSDSRRAGGRVPPYGATRMPKPDVLTKWMEAKPACATCSAHAPMRPRCPALRIAIAQKPDLPCLGDRKVHGLAADHLAVAELAVDDRVARRSRERRARAGWRAPCLWRASRRTWRRG